MPRVVDYKVSQIDGSLQRSGETSLHEVHTIVVDDVVDLEFIRLNCRAKLNHEHATFSGYFWDTIKPKRQTRLSWEVDCTATPFQYSEPLVNPLARPAVITYDGGLVIEPTNFDSKGYPIVTTAGEFIAGVERDRPVITFHVQKNLPADPAWLLTHIGATNADTVKLRGLRCDPKTLKLLNPSGGAYTVENGILFFPMTFDLVYDPLGHRVERWNVGTLQLVQRDGKKKGSKVWVQEPIRTGSPPRPVDEPVPLDIRGAALTDFLSSNEDGRPVDVSKLIKRKWDVQPVLNFNGILPLS